MIYNVFIVQLFSALGHDFKLKNIYNEQ